MSTAILQSPPMRQQSADAVRAQDADRAWRPLYRLGGVAALLLMVTVIVVIPVYIVSPPPTTVADWIAS